MKWSDLEASAPELAQLGMSGFREQNLCLLGTLWADGWPRISAVYISFGQWHRLLRWSPAGGFEELKHPGDG